MAGNKITTVMEMKIDQAEKDILKHKNSISSIKDVQAKLNKEYGETNSKLSALSVEYKKIVNQQKQLADLKKDKVGNKQEIANLTAIIAKRKLDYSLNLKNTKAKKAQIRESVSVTNEEIKKYDDLILKQKQSMVEMLAEKQKFVDKTTSWNNKLLSTQHKNAQIEQKTFRATEETKSKILLEESLYRSKVRQAEKQKAIANQQASLAGIKQGVGLQGFLSQGQQTSSELRDLNSQYRQAEKETSKFRRSQRELYKELYKNSQVTNEYRKRVKQLRDMHKAGAISTKEYRNAVKDLPARIDKTAKATTSLANATIRYLRWAGTIAGVLYAANRAWDVTIGKGIEVNRMMEDNTSGIAALLSANTQMQLSNGKSVTAFEKFGIAQTFAKNTMEQLRIESLKTPATFADLTAIYQQAIGQTLSFGDAFGSSVEDISKNTVELAKVISNIGGAIGQPMDRLREEIRSMLTGNVSTDSIISTMIFGSPTQANEMVKKAREKGQNALKELLDFKLGSFKILEQTRTFSKSILDVRDAWDMTMRDMVQKSGAFEDIKNMFYDMAYDIRENQDSIVEGFDSTYDVVKELIGILDELAIAGLVFYGSKGLISGVNKYGRATKGAALSMATLTKNVKSFIVLNAPLIAMAVAIGAITTGLAANSRSNEKYIDAQAEKYKKLYKTMSDGSETIASDIALVEKLGVAYARNAEAIARDGASGVLHEARIKEQKVIKQTLELLSKRIDVTKEERIEVAKKLKLLKNDEELVQKKAYNQLTAKNIQKSINKGKEKELELEKQIASFKVFKAKALDPSTGVVDQKRAAEATLAIASAEKELAEIRQKASEKANKSSEKILKAKQKEAKSLADIINATAKSASQQLQREDKLTKDAEKEALKRKEKLIELSLEKNEFLKNEERSWFFKWKQIQLEKQDLFKTMTAEQVALYKEAEEKKYKESQKFDEIKYEDLETYADAVRYINQDIEDGYKTSGQKIADVFKTLHSELESGFTNFFDITSDGFLDLEDLASNVLSSILRQIIQTQVSSPLADAAMSFDWTSLLGGFSFASGGSIPTKKFASGGKLTGGSGVRDDLYLGSASGSHVYAMGGEYILNKGATNSLGINTLDYMNKTGSVPSQNKSSGGDFYLNIDNQTGSEITAEQISDFTQPNSSGEEDRIINVVIKAATTNKGGLRDMIKGIA